MPDTGTHTYHGSYLMPSLEHATVADAMHPGILSCEPDATLSEVAQMMATQHVHCVAVVGISYATPQCFVWGIISDLDPMTQVAFCVGAVLSTLLSNVMLDDLDWELDNRGHNFVRYADDGRVYVHSRRAGERVMASITQYVEQRLKLKVNREKSVVARALRRPFLGFCLLPRMGEVRVLVDPKALRRAKDRLRAITSRRWGVSMERRIEEINRFTVGWTAYFRLADTPTPFEDLDEWLRRRLRQVRWKEWKRPRTRRRNLRALGISETNARQWASSRKGYWRIAGSKPLAVAMPNGYWTALGLQGFSDPYRRFRDAKRTAGCGPARPVVWGAPG